METFNSNTGASGRPMQSFSNAGQVRQIDGLGFEEDYVDCPYCEMRVRTKTEKTENENTQLWQFLCGMAFFPFCCCCTYPIPKKKQWHFHTQHRCRKCNTLLTTVRYNHQPSASGFVPSRWAKTYQEPEAIAGPTQMEATYQAKAGRKKG